MQWLEQQRRERRWWVAAATLGALSLVLGVVGVVPGFAEFSGASCTIDDSDDLAVSWSGMPDGMELTLVAETENGRIRTVATGLPGNVVGYGESGIWSGYPYPRAVRYALYSDPAAGGGAVRCEPSGAVAERALVDVHNGVGATNPGFESGSCPAAPGGGDAFGWHFVLTGNQSAFVEIEVVFESAGTVTQFVSDPSPKHAYVYSPGPDTIVAASAVIEGPVGTRMVLSHVCTPTSAEPPPVPPTPTRPPSPTAVPSATATPTSPSSPTAVPAATATPTSPSSPTAVPAATATPTSPSSPTAVPPAATSRPAPSPTATAVPTTTPPAAPTPARDDGTSERPGAPLHASISVVCAGPDAVVSVIVINPGDVERVAQIDVNGALDDLDVAPGATEVREITVAGQAEVSVVVTDESAEVLAAHEASDVCEAPSPALSAKATLFCELGSIKVLVVNTGAGDGVVHVDVDGITTSLAVPAGETVERIVAVETGTTVRVVVHDGTLPLLDTTFEGVCEQPRAVLAASLAVDCVVGAVTVTLVNSGDAEGSGRIVFDGTPAADVTVPPGSAIVRYITFDPSMAHTVVVDGADGAGGTLLSETIPVCDAPVAEVAADVAIDCEAGTVAVDFTNTGTAPATVAVTINGMSETFVLGAGTTEQRSAALVVGATTDVDVIVDGERLLRETTEDTCTTPGAEIVASTVLDCANRRIVIRLVNGGATAGEATVLVNGSARSVTVAAESTEIVTMDLDDAGDYLVDVSVDGMTILTEQASGACAVPQGSLLASVDLSCTHTEARVTVSNGLGVPATVIVSADGGEERFVIPAGDVVTRSVPLTEDADYDIVVTEDDGPVLAMAKGTFECEDAEVRAKTELKDPDVLTELPRTGAARPFVLVWAGISLVLTGAIALKAAAVRRERLAEVR